jgi:hypothetical protein
MNNSLDYDSFVIIMITDSKKLRNIQVKEVKWVAAFQNVGFSTVLQYLEQLIIFLLLTQL